MPTGYTSKLYDGEPQTFPAFAMSCARAFGALALLRDQPMDSPIPEELTPQTDYLDNDIDRLEATIAQAEEWSLAEAQAAADAERSTDRQRREEAGREELAIRERYEAMLAKVDAWVPPTEGHQGLKDFMVEQLRESLHHDCSGNSWPERDPLSGEAYRDVVISRAQRRLSSARTRRSEEIERTASRNAWLSALRASLPCVDYPS